MLLIGDTHPSVTAIVHRMLLGQNVILKSEVADFDGVILRVKVTPDENSSVSSPTAPSSPNIPAPSPNNGDDAPPPPVVVNTVMMKADIVITVKHIVPVKLLNQFGNYNEVVSALFPSGAFSFTDGEKGKITVTIAKTVAPSTRDNLLNLASQMRIFSYYPIFLFQSQKFLANPSTVSSVRIPYRPTESMYMFTNKKGDFYVVVSLIVPSKDDQLFVKNFLQSFVDVKRLDRSVASAPGFFFTSGKAPVDLPTNLIAEQEDDNTFWCNFQLTRLQCEKEAKMKEVAKQIVNFRNNLMFHIHGCRSYMHALMRQRVETAVRVIERAKTSTTGKSKVQLK